MENKKILIVDDEPDILKVVIFRIKKAGYAVVSAEDGKSALDITQVEKPDLILLDIRLPILTGYEVCKKLKSNKAVKDIPVIFLSASTGEDIDCKVVECGAQGYMRKPFEVEELLETIKKFIG